MAVIPSGGEPIPLPGAQLILWRAAVPAARADRWFADLDAGLRWHREVLTIFGRRVPVPRVVAWYGDPGSAYRYSGVTHEPLPWTPPLSEVRTRVQRLTRVRFNSVLANRYDGGADSMGWHADDEPELGPEPVIASLSLGAARKLRFRHRRREQPPLELWLEHGSLLLMRGPTQANWQHALPKTARPVGVRINLTFRRIDPRRV